MVVIVVYVFVLLQSPKFSFIKTNTPGPSEISTSSVDKLVIPKIDVRVPYFEGDQHSLERGAWHRYPERGNPEIGGNFILSAHRFNLGITPMGTKAKSPFYKIDKLKVGDDIYVTFHSKEYHYKVDRMYDVSRSATEIEAPSSEPKLTLYSCSLMGEKNGRVVVEAKPI